jgi:hypothetical protein
MAMDKQVFNCIAASSDLDAQNYFGITGAVRVEGGIRILCGYCAETDMWAWGQSGLQVSFGAVVHSTAEDPGAWRGKVCGDFDSCQGSVAFFFTISARKRNVSDLLLRPTIFNKCSH